MRSDDTEADDKPSYYRNVADRLRRIAARLPFDLTRADQLRALADGFERLAERLEREWAEHR